MRTATLDGWTIEDKSTVTVGLDPTSVTEWHLTRGIVGYKVSEIFGDWAVDEVFVGSQRQVIDRVLVGRGMPDTREIEEALDANTPEGPDG